MRRWLGFLVVLATVIVAGCGGAPSQPATSAPAPAPAAKAAPAPAAPVKAAAKDPGVTDNEVLLGTWSDLSGPGAAWGQINRTVDTYWKYVNATQNGINGRKVRFVLEDNGGSVPKTVTLVKKLVEQDKIFAMIGGSSTPPGVAVFDYVVGQGVVHMFPTSGGARWSTPLQRLYFGWQINYKVEGQILAKYAVNDLKKKKVAIFYQNDDYGNEGREASKEWVQKLGGQVAGEVAYNMTDVEFSAQALKLKGLAPEAVIAWGSVKQFAGLLKEADRIAFKPTWVAGSPVNDLSMFNLAGAAAEGVYFGAYMPNPNDPANASNPTVQEWRANLQKYNKDLPFSNWTLYGWEQARLAHEGIKRAGKELSRDTLIKSLETINTQNYKGLVPVAYSATDHRGVTTAWIEQLKSGKISQASKPINAE